MRKLLCLLFLVHAVARADDPRAVFKIEPASAAPGSTVTLPLLVNSNRRFEGYAYSIDFDEEVLEALAIEQVYERPDGQSWFFSVHRFNNENAHPGNGGIDEGYLVGAGVFDFRHDSDQIPAIDQDVVIMNFRFRVRSEAEAGATELRFMDGAIYAPGSPPVPNIVTLNGRSNVPATDIAATVVRGVLNIVADVTLFRRGDTNGDLVVNTSDAINTLSYLFRGTEPPSCLDSADANDDGRVNLTDGVFTLLALFVGSVVIPPPNEVPGSDPTPDDLLCLPPSRS